MRCIDNFVQTAYAYYRLLMPEIPPAPDYREIAREVVRSMYQGDRGHCIIHCSDDMFLSQGRYVTAEELSARKEELE